MNQTIDRPTAINVGTCSTPQRRPTRKLRRLAVWGFLVAVLSVGLLGQPAWAHGGEDTTEGYVFVHRALSYLVNDPSPDGIANALEATNEALANEDQDGVAVADLEQAKTALEVGDTATAELLLQSSIAEAIAELEPAVGDETGTTVMLAPFTRSPLADSTDWLFLALSALAAVGGALLAMRLRPREGLKELRRDILANQDKPRQPSESESNGSGKDAY